MGANPVLVLYVYVPSGTGPGHGDSGAVIDAFNETTGSLVDNDFVAVTPDPGGTLTNEANTEGWVDTQSSGYTIAADHPNIGPYMALPTNATFDQWVVLADPTPPSALVSGANLTPGAGVTVYALAFYKNPAITKPVVPDKNLKEYIKELEKQHQKEQIFEVGKTIVAEGPGKGLKENVEGPGFGNVGDPGQFGGVLGNLAARVSSLEAAQTAAKGKAFIKEKDRPAVGTPKVRKRRDL